MPSSARGTVADALRAAGYARVLEDYEFYPEPTGALETSPAELVAFWGEPADQLTAAVAVRWLPNGQPRPRFLQPLREALWAPYAIVAAPEGCELWETFPSSDAASVDALTPLATDIPYSRLGEVLAANQQHLGRDVIAATKRRWRQMALYEVDQEPNAFLRWAYQPARDRLGGVLTRVFREARRRFDSAGGLQAGHVRWLLRLIGVRIAWDKNWFDAGNRLSADQILADALRYPTKVERLDDLSPSAIEVLAEVVASSLGIVHLKAADGGLLSHLLQDSIPKDLQHAWKLYPTPQHVAWRMMATLPVETIPIDERRVWDGTCGSGTILVAALERLRALVPDLELPALRRYLVGAIAGNDLAVALADATRIALDQALGAPVGADWRIAVGDVAAAVPPGGEKGPTVIVGNPPFRASGKTPDTAIRVVSRYAASLSVGGLFSVVVPGSLCATDAARDLRWFLLREFDLYEVWELPKGAFRGTHQETVVLTGRRLFPGEEPSSAVTWRRFGAAERSAQIDTLARAAWLRDPHVPFLHPLGVRLIDHLAPFRRLADFVPPPNRTQGITPGAAGREDVLEAPPPLPSVVPYLVGREGMRPFFVPWDLHPRWLNYDSPRLQWPRRDKAWIFKARKVIVSRHATWGSAWRVRAAVDERGLFVSDQFNALVPAPPVTPEVVAALFNSALVNCWLKLANPAFSTTLKQMLLLPVPDELDFVLVERMEHLARALAQSRQAVALGKRVHGDLAAITLALDEAVYDAYRVPPSLRKEIAEHFWWYGDHRDGFDTPMVARPEEYQVAEAQEFTTRDSDRLKQLLAKQAEERLTNVEEAELDDLINLWQRAHTAATLNPDVFDRSEAQAAVPEVAR